MIHAKNINRLLGVLFALVMIVGLLPVRAFAENDSSASNMNFHIENNGVEVSEWSFPNVQEGYTVVSGSNGDAVFSLPNRGVGILSYSVFGGGEAFSCAIAQSQAEVGNSGVLRITVKEGLAPGTYSETVTVAGTDASMNTLNRQIQVSVEVVPAVANSFVRSYEYDGSGGAPGDFDLSAYWKANDLETIRIVKPDTVVVLPTPPTTAFTHNAENKKGAWSFAWTVTDKNGSVPVTNGSFVMPVASVTITGAWRFTPNAGTAPEITTTDLLRATVSSQYEGIIEATGDTPLTWTVSGDLPENVIADASETGLKLTMHGDIPANGAGFYDITVRAENNAGFDEKTFTLFVAHNSNLQSVVTPSKDDSISSGKQQANAGNDSAGTSNRASATQEKKNSSTASSVADASKASPKTGDESNSTLWFATTAVSLTALVLALFGMRTRTRRGAADK